jgi:hypothetical protein
MTNTHRRVPILLSLVLLATCVAPQFAVAQSASPDLLWQHVPELPPAPANARAPIQPKMFKTFTLDTPMMRAALASAPAENRRLSPDAGVQITLPMPDGTFARFEIEEVALMEPELAAKFPEIKTYRGRGIDDPAARLHLDINPRTLHAQILSPKGAVYIDPYWHLDGRLYMAYRKSDLERDTDAFKCHVEHHEPEPASLEATSATIDNAASGQMLRIYRLACATSIQYSQYHSADPTNPTVAEVMAALVTMNNRVSGIYETELAIRMVLVAENDVLVATVSNPQPYTDTPADIDINPTNIDARIGSDAYDIGHVVTVGSGGVAGLGVVCRVTAVAGEPVRSLKARGTTGFDPPVGDPFWVDYVAHEMGHQYGGNHTFNGSGTNCGTQQNANTAYEPGSGSTIQAYAGICGSANNLQPNSDPYFHFISLIEMWNFSNTGAGNGCPVKVSLGNTAPTVNARQPEVAPPADAGVHDPR